MGVARQGSAALTLALLLLLLLLLFWPQPTDLNAIDGRLLSRLRACVERLHVANDGEVPWLAVYGDSLARGIFFDVVDALNSSGTTLPEKVCARARTMHAHTQTEAIP